MAYLTTCGEDARIATHCGTFLHPGNPYSTPAPDEAPLATPDTTKRPAFGGPLFEAMRTNELLELSAPALRPVG